MPEKPLNDQRGDQWADQRDEKTVPQSSPEGWAPEVQRKRSCLIVIHGPHLGKKYNLEDGSWLVGRTDAVDIQINEENVSRRHAKVTIASDKAMITDLNSTNGVFVNTKRIKSQELKDGDLVLIGNTIFKFISSTNIETAYHEEIYKLATLDGLTQVYNKKYLIEQLNAEFSRTQRYGHPLSLIIFDFDNFKKLNDRYGHLAGDFVLKHSASLVMRNLRKEDALGRYGGEEFAIILPETDQFQAYQIADKIRLLIEGMDYVFNDEHLPVTISVGVATLNQDTPMINYNDLIERSDMALYEAKNGGRNCVVASKKK